MHARQPVPAALQRLADCQAGVVTREQALGHGLSAHVIARLLDQQVWQSMARAVYLTTVTSWTAVAWGGVLLGGDRARLGAEPTAHLLGLVDPPAVVEILVPPNRLVRTPANYWTFIRERPGVRPGRTTGSPPRLPTEVALLELITTRNDDDAIVLLAEAQHRRVTAASRLLTTLSRYPRYPKRAFVRELLGDLASGRQSPIERRYARIESDHALPPGLAQRPNIALNHDSDVAYEEFGLLIELDGRAWHDGAQRFRDLWLDNQFALRGQLTIRIGALDLARRPCAVAFLVHTLLNQRGWLEPFARCRQCAGALDQDLLLA